MRIDRSLLASQAQGSAVQQVTITVEGVAVTQNIVVYADGTQVAQQSGAAELAGFTETVVSAEQMIQNGGQTVASVYNDRVAVDLTQYQQVGATVTYSVVAGAGEQAQLPKIQMEQTTLAAGQEVMVLITDAYGNVTAATAIVGANGIVQYQLPGVNCIVRLMSRIG